MKKSYAFKHSILSLVDPFDQEKRGIPTSCRRLEIRFVHSIR